MAKIAPISKDELIKAINEEGLGIGHPFETEWEFGNKREKAHHLPGSVGVTRTYNGYMTYCVDADGKFTKCSTHKSWKECYGMALRRYREFAKEEGFVKATGDSFSYGPVTTEPSLRQQEADEIGLDWYMYSLYKTEYKKQANWKRPGFWAYEIFIHATANPMAVIKTNIQLSEVEAVVKASYPDAYKIEMEFCPSAVKVVFRYDENVTGRKAVHPLYDYIAQLLS